MKFDPQKHHRHSIRLKGYDYSQPGGYFVTIVTSNRQCLFGAVEDGDMILNDGGTFARKCWIEIPNHFPHARLDEFIIMPNHIHGIIFIGDINVGVQNLEPLQKIEPQHEIESLQNIESLRKQNKYQKIIPRSIGSIIRGFKIGVTKWFRHNTEVYNVWQRNYWEHIVRDENELNRIREYIINNPWKWELDDEFTNNS